MNVNNPGEVPTREIYLFPVVGTQLLIQNNHQGYQINLNGEYADFEFQVPWDFHALASCVIRFWHNHAGGFTDRLSFYVWHGGLGEAPDLHTDSILDVDWNGGLVSNTYKEYDVVNMLAALAAGDHVRIRAVATAVNVPAITIQGMTFRYN